MKKPFLGDPSLFVPTRIVVTKPFFVAGKRVEVGECVEVTFELARDLVTYGRAKYKKIPAGE